MANRRPFPLRLFHPIFPSMRILLSGSALAILAACSGPFDYDLRGNLGNGFDTSDAAIGATADRPQTDNRGVISYPNYQVAVANRGDTVGDVATRIGLEAEELARYNGIGANVPLREGEILALPRRVTEPSPATGAIATGPILPAETIDITSLAGEAIDRAGPSTTTQPHIDTPANAPQTGDEPVRHKVARGETAYSVARLYDVSVRSLAEWNALGADLSVREGQYLLIPVTITEAPLPVETDPGQGSPTPTPPSASTPLPAENATPDPSAETPDSPNLAEDKTAASGTSTLLFPVEGNVIRPYEKGKSEGIDIAAAAGALVKAAKDGSVAAITQDTQQVTIIVMKHADNLLTVYANVDGVTVKKGDTVKRGQTIGSVRASDPPFLHFEVRKGFASVDPMPFFN